MSEALSNLPPVIGTNARLLILGSLPGAASLAVQRYYAHPRNQFWRLVGDAIGHDLASLDYDQRLEALLAARIGLWDTVASGHRVGSLDAALRGTVPSDLASLVSALPDLKAIAFNGGTAARIGRRALAVERGLRLIDLPSSAPLMSSHLNPSGSPGLCCTAALAAERCCRKDSPGREKRVLASRVPRGCRK